MLLIVSPNQRSDRTEDLFARERVVVGNISEHVRREHPSLWRAADQLACARIQ
jgi:hypothetical protein